MINPKFVTIAGISGFVLSLIVGLFAGNSFGIVFLRALFSALGFAVMALLGCVVYSRFLKTSITTETVEEENTARSSDLDEDEPLTEDNGPGFYMDIPGKRAFTSDVSKAVNEATDSVSVTEDDGVRTNVVKTDVVKTDEATTQSSPELKPSETTETEVVSNASFGQDSEVLDELPEISAYTVKESDENATETPLVADVSFVPSSLNDLTGGHDANIYAQAIHTVMDS